jgi:ribosomal-protein-alanine N-acetyltransferase
VADPFPAIRGQKVLLRPFAASDIDDAYIGWLNDPEVVRFSNQRFIVHGRESSQRYLRSFEGTDNLFMSARRLADDRAIGTLTAYLSRYHNTADVGIMIGDKAVWGQGYGQDAWSTFTEWLLAERRIRKLTAGALACNHAMVKLMEYSGMAREAVRTRQEVVEGRAEDIVYYAKFSGH